MITERQVSELLALIRLRYPDWQDFAHPPFWEDELAYKRATIAKAHELINQETLDALLTDGAYDEILSRLDKLAKDNNLLWRRVPSAGDTAVFHQPALNKANFCTQVRQLLYGDAATPLRLQTFSTSLTTHDLPNKWPLPTYLLFITHPDKDIFVKPQAASWFLKFMGESGTITAPPDSETYRLFRDYAQELLKALQAYGAQDMVDVQSCIWVCFRESKKRTGHLNAKGQVDFDIPKSKPAPLPETASTTQPASTGAASIFQEPPPVYSPTGQPDYKLSDCATNIGVSPAEVERWLTGIQRKGQAIFYGPPGTGKTHAARHIARHLAGGGDGLIEMVQFHTAYAYEDFIQGLRPFSTPDGTLTYKMIPGRFLQFCQEASQQEDTCVFIIDEINRGNITAVFGELMLLLEYRDKTIPLAGGGTFSLPGNIIILGTMNTADRSIALVDHALRRRFAFIQLQPNYDLLARFHSYTDFNPAPLITTLQRLNNQIGDPHYHLGHTYFLSHNLHTALPSIWQMEIEPTLEEYFFDRPDLVEEFRWENLSINCVKT
ncbi:MAG: hypothetical protein CSB13_10125 [Chloroflexi bacterium]|nr:MAG: hypothetical protein CSB13_10125 [Chloroflexota bacterium]